MLQPCGTDPVTGVSPMRAAPLTPWLATLGLTPLFAAVLVGAAQNVFSKSAKYSLFDPCKEMAYIPLDQETQLKARMRGGALDCLADGQLPCDSLLDNLAVWTTC